MVTNLRERGREQCLKYWKDEEDDEPMIVGNQFEVHTVDTHIYADHTVREFRLQQLPPGSPIHSPKSNGPSSPLLSVHHNMLNSSYSRNSMNQEIPIRALSRSNTRSESLSSPTSNRYDADYANLPRRPGSTNSNRSNRPQTLGDAQRVLQYHFTSWSDYKAPECTIGLLRLICKLRKMDEYNNYPVVVHCSAGVGRTGTFIAIDYVMDQCKAEGRADVFGCVSQLRMQRNLMVQSLEQYVFIYKALAEYQLFGNTDMRIDDFIPHYQKLRQPLKRERHQSIGASDNNKVNGDIKMNGVRDDDRSVFTERNSEKNGVGALFNQKIKQFRTGNSSSVDAQKSTLLEDEFNKLRQCLEKPRTTQWAHKNEHASRNRFDDTVPYDQNRVILAPLMDYPNTYINASQVKGYFYPFVLAQDPLGPETAHDFWRMVNDQNSYTIVMLGPDDTFTAKEKVSRLTITTFST